MPLSTCCGRVQWRLLPPTFTTPDCATIISEPGRQAGVGSGCTTRCVVTSRSFGPHARAHAGIIDSQIRSDHEKGGSGLDGGKRIPVASATSSV